MNDNIKDFGESHNEKLKKFSKEERVKAGLKKLAQELEANQGEYKEPKGLVSGKADKDGRMIVDLDEDYDDE